MQLDIRANSVIPTYFRGIYESVAMEFRNSFNEIIEEVSKDHMDNFDWFLTLPISRNPFASQLFKELINICYIEKLIDEGLTINCIFVESLIQKKIIKEYIRKKNLSISVHLPGQYKSILLIIYENFKQLFIVIVVICKLLREWLFLNKAFKGSISLPTKPIVLIGNFITSVHSSHDNYYANLNQLLTQSEQKEVFFVPTFVNLSKKELLEVIEYLRDKEDMFILKEPFLNLRDYLFAFFHVFRKLKFKVKKIKLHGVDISGFILQEIRKMNGLESSIIALLNYRFASLLKEHNVQLRLIINWFENQTIEKGWNKGFNEYYSSSLSLGYAGYVASPFYLNLYPTKLDQKLGFLPKKVCVIGKGLKKAVSEFCPDLDVEVAPAFRFQHVWKEQNHTKKSDKFRILVTLPYFEEFARAMMLTLFEANANLSSKKKIIFVIKLHPDHSKDIILKICPKKIMDSLEFTFKKFQDVLDETNLLINVGSSTSIEALAKGVPVIIFGNLYGLTHNPIPKYYDNNIWRLCYSSKEISEAIIFFANQDTTAIANLKKIGIDIRHEYFSPVTRQSVKNFLTLSD